jgi:diacylglycerol kinase family enzyme
MTEKRATIIFNPMSGRPARRAENVRGMIELLKKRGINTVGKATAGPMDATQLAREAVAGGAEIIISYGGDGTLNEVLQGIVGSRAALAVWPGGTSNVVARDLSITNKLEAIADLIAAGKTVRVSLGLSRGQGSGVRDQGHEMEACSVSFADPDKNVIETSASLPDSTLRLPTPDPRPLQRYFLMMAGIGLDASIARTVNKKLKRRTGEFAYWVAGVNHLFRWKPEPFVIEVDGQSYESVFAVIGNGKGYGGRMCMTPGAKLEEPGFQIYLLPRMSNNFSYIGALSACLRGRPETTRAKIVEGRHIKASCSRETWVEVDGEVIGRLPMTFESVPDALSLIVP